MEADKKVQIFSTGVHLQAIEVIIGGIKQWRWIVVGFEDDSFINGKTIDVFEYANSKEELFQEKIDENIL
ncbi:MAG: hypothetical protein Q4A09_08525 [Capnocytophaga felis]|nr:hypothetical protein [Capnocytophaga felis]